MKRRLLTPDASVEQPAGRHVRYLLPLDPAFDGSVDVASIRPANRGDSLDVTARLEVEHIAVDVSGGVAGIRYRIRLTPALAFVVRVGRRVAAPAPATFSASRDLPAPTEDAYGEDIFLEAQVDPVFLIARVQPC